ncbi:dTDP-4-dehydrorhamnose reductase [Azospirillum sp. BE72]|uniref:dTDP-4-dehydrorhamnose reductase n=2 Tax=unclassified Azospirillum TaxID=2630922 RepID=UPI00285D5B22|nr:dTDP-4-dehydrorhamnose reductase [Azospirillum sp. BE72]MDR6774136.1 dTDP-4-dehydrorhamnose reductase [Azospirillum sp. BE72]
MKVPMKVLVLGSNGQLGFELMRANWAPGTDVVGLPYPEFDVTRPGDVEKAVATHAPDLLVNATAHTAVDKAESEVDLSFAVNRDGPGAMAAACAARGIPFIHVSTDYVFDGTKDGLYTEDDPINPLGVYGASKAAGEETVRAATPRHVILRTSWVYSAYGNNFVKTMLRFGKEREEMRVVADQHGSPTAAADLAAAIVRIAGTIEKTGAAAWGTYHLTGSGYTTWHDFAEHIFRRLEERTGKRPRLTAIGTADYPTPARRPANSRLDCSRAKERLGVTCPPWQESVDRVIDELFTNPPQA